MKRYSLVLLLWLVPATGFGQVQLFLDSGDSVACFTAAANALTLFKAVAPKDSLSRFGFADTADLASASLGPPIPMVTVLSKNIQTYDTSFGVTGMFEPRPRAFFPVQLGGVTKACLVMTNDGKSWQLERGGGAAFARAIDTTISLMLPGNVPHQNVFILSIPFFNIDAPAFFSAPGTVTLQLTSPIFIPQVPLVGNIDASKLFLALKPEVALVGPGLR